MANNRPGHHDVTSKDARLKGAQASVIEAPVYPNTWLSVRLKDPPYKIVKVRTSQLAQPTAVDDTPAKVAVPPPKAFMPFMPFVDALRFARQEKER